MDSVHEPHSSDADVRRLLDLSRRATTELARVAQTHLPSVIGSRCSDLDSWMSKLPTRHRSYARSLSRKGDAMASRLADSGFDHLFALHDALRPDARPRTWAYLTLARAISEAFIRAAVLSDRRTEPRLSVLTASAYAIDGWNEHLKIASDVLRREPDTDVRAVNKAAARELLKVQRAGITVVNDKRGWPIALTGYGARVQVKLNLTAESDRRITAMPAPYRIGSAAAHGAHWLLSGELVNGEVTQEGSPIDPNLIIGAVYLSLLSLLALVEAADGDGDFAVEFKEATEYWRSDIAAPFMRWQMRTNAGPTNEDG